MNALEFVLRIVRSRDNLNNTINLFINVSDNLVCMYDISLD